MRSVQNPSVKHVVQDMIVKFGCCAHLVGGNARDRQTIANQAGIQMVSRNGWKTECRTAFLTQGLQILHMLNITEQLLPSSDDARVHPSGYGGLSMSEQSEC